MPENEFENRPAFPVQTGTLQVRLVEARTHRPVPGAEVEIAYEGDPEGGSQTFTTDESGMTEQITLPAPDKEYSTQFSEEQPYSEYNIRVRAQGYEDVEVSGSEVLPTVESIQEISMYTATPGELFERIVIGPHTLFGNYPPKIAEPEIQPMSETGEIVLSRVVIPEYIVVHDGVPTDTSAKNYWVRYRDYIKNVASSEIYATWTDSAIRANVLAIMSFVLNRVYTEW
jgi:hypothetical protein